MVRRKRTTAIPTPRPHIDVEEAARLLAKGLTYTEIGTKLGYRPSSVRRRLLESGIRPPRRRSCRGEKWGEKLYTVWKRMRRLASEQGVSLSKKWSTFNAFYDWALCAGYRPGLYLTRKTQTRDFVPSNCHWGAKRRAPKARARRPPKKLTERQWNRAVSLHSDQGLSCPAVARKLGVAHATILRGLKLRGVYRPAVPKVSGTANGRKLYQSWLSMRSHCNDPNDSAYRYYGGAGARICREWEEFEAYYTWALDAGWEPGLCLTRRGRTRVFSPANCRWVTRAEAARNAHHPSSKMPPRWTVTAFGETKGPTDWSRDRRCAVTLAGLLRRLRTGWSPERAIATPPQWDTGPRPTRLLTAFGRTKSVSEWSRDKCCEVTLPTIQRRLERGIRPEDAISSKPFRCPRDEHVT